MSDTGNTVESLINRIWYGDSLTYLFLLPLSGLFALIAAARRLMYRKGILRSHKMPVPVVVVGNITAGGAGKTPVTVWLAEVLKGKGMSPAIISRGYCGNVTDAVLEVNAASDPGLVGDEPVLLARRTGCPVLVNANRVESALKAVSQGADVIISDDGLQHYRLRRDAEIAVVDGSRGLGNGHLLPAGPLRESERRLMSVDRVMVQRAVGDAGTLYGNRTLDIRTSRFSLAGETLHNIADETKTELKKFDGQSVHAVAGIANPERFFRQLESHGIKVIRHPLPDHARITAADVSFDDELAVIVTEKDAVKCTAIAHERLWYLSVHVVFDVDQQTQWVAALHAKLQASQTQESA
jgi:tetraacyldisaccharide 4'-kinase